MTEEGNGRAIGIAMLIGSIGMIALCLMCIVALVKCVPSEKTNQLVDTIHEVVWDTIPYYYPEPKDSVVVRYITQKLPITSGEETNSLIKSQLVGSVEKEDSDSGKDSVNVVLPITQKHYEDSTFSAWVSGYNPALDSIYVYPRTEIKTITIHTTERKRWSIGVSGGLGVVYDGKGWHCGPGINIGVTYSF